MYLLVPEDNIIQSACIKILGIMINKRKLFAKNYTLAMQYILLIIFVLDPDGALIIGHVILH